MIYWSDPSRSSTTGRTKRHRVLPSPLRPFRIIRAKSSVVIKLSQETRRNFFLFPFSIPFLSFPFFFFLPLKDSPFVYIESNFPPFLSDDSHVSAICYTEREASRNTAIVATTLPHAKAITNAAWLHRWWCDGGRGGVRFSLNKVAAIFQTSGRFVTRGKVRPFTTYTRRGRVVFINVCACVGGEEKTGVYNRNHKSSARWQQLWYIN